MNYLILIGVLAIGAGIGFVSAVGSVCEVG
jgi:protein-L-isoaspartate O-methyltransferase